MKKGLVLLLITVGTLLGKGDLMCWVPSWSTVGSHQKYCTLLDTMDYSSFSHVVYSFATPDGNGGLLNPIDTVILRTLEQRGHKAGAKVILAFGGGASESYDPDKAFMNMVENPAAMKRYVDTLMFYVRTFNLDGLDNDWEPYWETRATRRESYEKLMTVLRDSLKEKTLMADIYLNPGSCSHLSDSSLKMMDNVNLMTYENNFGPYFSGSVSTALDEWKNHGVVLEKIALILPFWGAKPNTWGPNYLYCDIIRDHPEAADQDSVTIDGSPVWFGSKRVLKELTTMAGTRCGGVGFWHVGLDSPGEHSLISVLRTATDSIKGTGIGDQVNVHRSSSQLYLNNDRIVIAGLAQRSGEISLYSLAGRELYTQEIVLTSGSANIAIDHLPRGPLVAEFRSGNDVLTAKVLH